MKFHLNVLLCMWCSKAEMFEPNHCYLDALDWNIFRLWFEQENGGITRQNGLRRGLAIDYRKKRGEEKEVKSERLWERNSTNDRGRKRQHNEHIHKVETDKLISNTQAYSLSSDHKYFKLEAASSSHARITEPNGVLHVLLTSPNKYVTLQLVLQERRCFSSVQSDF